MPQVDVFQALLKMADLSRSTQDHMIQVYQALLTMAVAAAVGSLVQARFALGGLFTFVGVLGSVIWLAMNPFKPNDTAVNNKRIGLACLVAFFTGVSMGPLLSMVYQTQGDGYVLKFCNRRALEAKFRSDSFCFICVAYFAQRHCPSLRWNSCHVYLLLCKCDAMEQTQHHVHCVPDWLSYFGGVHSRPFQPLLPYPLHWHPSFGGRSCSILPLCHL